jgi:hydrogenase maturation protease
MSVPRILIAGVGHLFMGDDAFGCHVARRLAERPLPEGVRVVDFGIRGLDLAYAILDGFDTVILVDASPRGHPPGTLFVIEPRAGRPHGPTLDAHGMDPARVLETVAALGGRVGRVLVVGCEPAPRHPDADWEMSLSEPVRAAVDEAVLLIESLIANGGRYDESTGTSRTHGSAAFL